MLLVVYILIALGGTAVFGVILRLRRRLERLEREHARMVRDLAGLLVITELGLDSEKGPVAKDSSAPALPSTQLRSVTPLELAPSRRGSTADTTAGNGPARAKPLLFSEDDL